MKIYTIKLWFFSFYCLFLCACNVKDGQSLKRSFKLADKNVSELKAVLDHYSNPHDSLKLRAARFLISQMWCHRSLNVSKIEGHDGLFDALEKDYIGSNQHTVDAFRLVYDSLHFSAPSALSGPNDCRIVDANYLILNIDFAFKTWKTYPWTQNVSFDDFCEYVLPYHLQFEPIEFWRPGFNNRFYPICFQSSDVLDLKKVYSTVQLNMYKTARVENAFEELYSIPMGVSDMLVSEMGSCIQTNIFRIMALRSVGIPVTMDFVPHWGDYGGHHEKVRLIPQKPERLLTNANSPEYVGTIFDAINLVGKDECAIDSLKLPDWLTIHFNKRVPKIYRIMWSEQLDVTKLLTSAHRDEIYPGWSDLYRRDVSEEYLKYSNVQVCVDKDQKKSKLLYACVFDRERWVPVCVTSIDEKGKAVFPKMGRNIVYLPMVYHSGELLPAALPFYITLMGKAVNLRTSTTQKHSVTLHSKYPLFVNIANRALKMQGGVFQGANRSDFKDSVTLHRIADCPFYINSVPVNINMKFRYYRFLPAAQYTCSIGEVSFFKLSDKDTTRIEGTFLGSEPSESKDFGKAFDGNYVTYYENKSGLNAWIGIDAVREERLVRIEFSPRGDGNGIIPNSTYELFYYNNGWKSLGSKIASSAILQYSEVPCGALLWLKCQSEGKEERIFTYEKGKQVWW